MEPRNRDSCLRTGTHEMFILNSNLPITFLTNLKGGSGLVFFFGEIGMFPAQQLMNHFPKS